MSAGAVFGFRRRLSNRGCDIGRRGAPSSSCKRGETLSLDQRSQAHALFRVAIGLACPTREVIAETIGLTRPALNNYLQGDRRVPMRVNAVLSNVLREHSQNLLVAAEAIDASFLDGHLTTLPNPLDTP